MMRGLIKATLILVVLVAAGFFAFGYWTSGSLSSAPAENPASVTIDTRAVRERGAELGEQAARVATAVNESIEEGTLTGKIKAKMVLDDLVKARTINVTTNGSTCTLSGTVHSEKERERAVQLARETDGITRVIDQLVIQQS